MLDGNMFFSFSLFLPTNYLARVLIHSPEGAGKERAF